VDEASADRDEIEWYPLDGVAPSTAGNESAAPAERFGVGAIVGIVFVAIVGLWAIQATGGSEAATAPTIAAEPTSTPEPAPTTVAVGPEAAVLGELAGLTLFVTQHDGGPPQRLRSTDRGQLAVTDDLDGLRDFSVDVSGEWFAAVSDSTTLRGAQVLWVGTLDEAPQPVGVEVRGYAWHDTEPGMIAFVTGRPGAEGARMVSVDLRRAQPRTVELGTTDGWLHSWGDWGHTMRSQRVGSHLDLHDADGNLVSDPYVIAPGESEPTIVPWLADFQHVWNLAASPNPSAPMVAVQATNFDDDRHEVVVVDVAGQPEVIARIPSVGGSAALAWTPDGDALFFVREDHRTQTDLVIYEPAADATEIIALPALRAEDHWTRAIAVPN